MSVRNWIVCTGGDQWVAQAETPLEVAIDAFKRRPPTACGLITSIREPHLTDEEGYVVATAHALEGAGLNFRLREGAPDYAKAAIGRTTPKDPV